MDDIIKTLLAEWQKKELPFTISRQIDLSTYAELKPPKIVVVTGFRRVGKTYLLFNLIKNLLNNRTRSVAVCKKSLFY